jgi:hypothetical protein
MGNFGFGHQKPVDGSRRVVYCLGDFSRSGRWVGPDRAVLRRSVSDGSFGRWLPLGIAR